MAYFLIYFAISDYFMPPVSFSLMLYFFSMLLLDAAMSHSPLIDAAATLILIFSPDAAYFAAMMITIFLMLMAPYAACHCRAAAAAAAFRCRQRVIYAMPCRLMRCCHAATMLCCRALLATASLLLSLPLLMSPCYAFDILPLFTPMPPLLLIFSDDA